MKIIELLKIFNVNVLVSVPAFSATAALATGVVVPLLVWTFTNQLKWLSFNEWIGYVLLGIPIGIMASGMMTLREWFEASEVAIARKLAISVVITTIIMWSMFAMVGVINSLFPH